MSRFGKLFTGAEAAEAQTEAEAPKAHYKLLLVDDEPNILKALVRVFHRENYQVSTAANGKEALELLQREHFQVLISDYMMPFMNGGELLSQARAVQPDAMRIMLTGHADTGAVMAAIADGAVYKFILKPWHDDDLRVTVALAIEQYELIQKNRALSAANREQEREIASLSKMTVTNRSQLAIALHKRNLLTSHQVQELHRLQQQRKEPIAKILSEFGWVSENTVRDCLKRELLIDEVALPEFQIDSALAALIPRVFCERQLVIPLKLEGKRLLLAMADPLDQGLLEDLRFMCGLYIEPVSAGISAIRDKIEELYHDTELDFKELETIIDGADPFDGVEVVIEDDEDVSLEQLLRGTEEPPAIRLANAIVLEAIRLGASDIHIQPRTKSVVVRYRIDGILWDKIQIPTHLLQPLVSRLKIIAELDISERRRPQDGRITVKTPLKVVDLRISTLPTINGEKVVMRLLDRNSAVMAIDRLGFGDSDTARIQRMVDKPQGIILATGPTGSGKTTTLYALLQHNATPTKNYVTIEDPVEYYLDQAGQVLIREKIGLTFPIVLRSILRQDPDVILLGEIRDIETAEVAFHAAMTGHLVYSTLHTNSSAATVSRLLDLGLNANVIATALEGIIAQRLVRRICDHCKQPAAVPQELLARLGSRFAQVSRHSIGAGCGHCHGSGYKGRLGLYEVMTPTEQIRDLISRRATTLEIQSAMKEAGIASIVDDAIGKIEAGLTTAEEVLRVLGPQ